MSVMREDLTCVQVCHTDPQNPSPIALAEKAGRALQTELLRLNEFTGNRRVVNRLADKLTCTLFTVCLFVQKSRPTCHNRPIGDQSAASVGRLAAKESESTVQKLILYCCCICSFA